MTCESWLKCSCPKCGKVNWIYNGYVPEPDSSKLDPDGFRCWSCDEIIWLSDEIEFRDNIVDGKLSPE